MLLIVFRITVDYQVKPRDIQLSEAVYPAVKVVALPEGAFADDYTYEQWPVVAVLGDGLSGQSLGDLRPRALQVVDGDGGRDDGGDVQLTLPSQRCSDVLADLRSFE